MRAARWLAVAGVVALLAGCGTVQAGQPAPSDTSSGAAGVAAAAHPTPARQAAADAARLLASFTPPPGAVRLARAPLSLLRTPPLQTASGDEVIREGWWRVAGQPQAVLSWIQAHRPAGSAGAGTGGFGRPVGGSKPSGGVPHAAPPPLDLEVSYAMFGLADVPGVLLDRTVIAAVEADGRDTTAIGVYAEVLWQPTRTAASLVPAAARLVTIAPLPGDKPPAAADRPVTLTDPATVARVAAVVNALPVEPSAGFIECGPTNGTGMRLTFRATAAGPALAVASGYQTLCGMVSLVVDGKQTPVLSGGETMFQRVLTIAGLHWSDFPVPAPDNVPTTPPPTGPS